MIYEQRSWNGELVQTVRIPLETTPELLAQYAQDGFTEVYEHSLVLYKPPEAEVLKDRLEQIADALPDELAANFPNLYGELVGDEQPVPAGQRRVFNGELYAAKVTLWDRPDQWPDQQPDLWRKITKTGEIENWVQPSGEHDAYHFGAVRAHVGKVWRSTVEDGSNGEPKNVWEPGVYGWEEVTE